ncbi:hypothetical protein D5777_23520 [Salmonella enterica subsp. enterica serovar Kottbus]|nr:hypothetical protein [Salmonella enterica subsp. enterica serovar Kottbus]EBY6716319.1 hypothetical protein [Salmonella enterica subsp. enterica serovar Kottbus]EBZ6410175.1 hypothetical protein [Salmonella enterica subsp. enterica serovar Kottbus]ECB3489084.1 hypothetical protein [Salmonella enterica subsp. enterica serovar Kottbus]ECY6288043.1 hypothetical protein [Salmonella enterica subsp. enterica serovar Kottbus]
MEKLTRRRCKTFRWPAIRQTRVRMIDFARKPARIQAISGETTGLQLHDTEHTTRKRVAGYVHIVPVVNPA